MKKKDFITFGLSLFVARLIYNSLCCFLRDQAKVTSGHLWTEKKNNNNNKMRQTNQADDVRGGVVFCFYKLQATCLDVLQQPSTNSSQNYRHCKFAKQFFDKSQGEGQQNLPKNSTWCRLAGEGKERNTCW